MCVVARLCPSGGYSLCALLLHRACGSADLTPQCSALSSPVHGLYMPLGSKHYFGAFKAPYGYVISQILLLSFGDSLLLVPAGDNITSGGCGVKTSSWILFDKCRGNRALPKEQALVSLTKGIPEDGAFQGAARKLKLLKFSGDGRSPGGALSHSPSQVSARLFSHLP